MAKLTERGGDRPWQVRYRDPEGKQRSRQFRTKADAQRFRKTVEHDVLTGAYIAPSAGRETVGEHAERWIATKLDMRPSSRVRVLGIIRNHVVPHWGPRALSGVSHEDVRSWVAALSDGLSARSVRKVYDTFSSIMDSAVDAKKILANPCARVPLPRVEDKERRFLTVDELRALADAVPARDRALILVAGLCGLRFGELAALRRGRIDLLRKRLRVEETAVEIAGRVTYGRPKSAAGVRTVGIPGAAFTALTDHLDRYVDSGADALVFTSAQGGPLRAPNWRKRIFDPAVKATGLGPLRPHDLRHTSVALAIRAGLAPLEISRRTGHSSVGFTLGAYGGLFEDTHDRQADALDALLEATPDRDAEVRSLR